MRVESSVTFRMFDMTYSTDGELTLNKQHVCKSGELASAYCAADSQTEATLWILDLVNSLTFAADRDKEIFHHDFCGVFFCLD